MSPWPFCSFQTSGWLLTVLHWKFWHIPVLQFPEWPGTTDGVIAVQCMLQTSRRLTILSLVFFTRLKYLVGFFFFLAFQVSYPRIDEVQNFLSLEELALCAGHEVLMEVKDYFTLIASDSQGSNQPMNSLANTRHMLLNVISNFGIFLNWQNGRKKMLKTLLQIL